MPRCQSRIGKRVAIEPAQRHAGKPIRWQLTKGNRERKPRPMFGGALLLIFELPVAGATRCLISYS
jgi:hypothetical protein